MQKRMSLIEKVTQTIRYTLTSDLAEFLADHFGLDSYDVAEAIRDYLGYNSTPVAPTPKIVKKKKTPPVKPATARIKTCKFRVTRGSKEGKLCGTTIRGGGDYCSKHKNRKILGT